MINITFAIPEKVSTNAIYAGMHWSKRKKLADLYHNYMKQFKLKVTEYPVDISYIFTFKNNPLDTSNTAFMAKMIEDGLVSSGVIDDDSVQHIQSTTLISQKGKKDEVNIIIT